MPCIHVYRRLRGIPKSLRIDDPHYFVTSDFRGFGVTTPLSSQSVQHQADYIINPTTRIGPEGSPNLQSKSLHEIQPSRFFDVIASLFSQSGQHRADFIVDMKATIGLKGSQDQRSLSLRGSDLQGFWLHCHSIFLKL
jgi:hypothetical protein